jgi:hypothetical protein
MKNSLRRYFFVVFGTACLSLLFLAQDSVSAQTGSHTANLQLETWKTFAPQGKNFKISLPAEPKELDSYETDKLVTLLNSQINKSGSQLPALNNVTVYELETRWAGYGILVIDYKWQQIDYDEKSGVLILSSETKTDETLLNQWMRFEKAKMLPNGVFVSDTTFFKDTKSFKARAMATKNKVVMLFVGTPDLRSATPELAKVYQAETEKFFNSLQILDNKPQVARDNSAKSVKKAN